MGHSLCLISRSLARGGQAMPTNHLTACYYPIASRADPGRWRGNHSTGSPWDSHHTLRVSPPTQIHQDKVPSNGGGQRDDNSHRGTGDLPVWSGIQQSYPLAGSSGGVPQCRQPHARPHTPRPGPSCTLHRTASHVPSETAPSWLETTPSLALSSSGKRALGIPQSILHQVASMNLVLNLMGRSSQRF